MFGEKTGGIGNQKKNQSHPDCSITEIGQNTEKSPEKLKNLAVTQTPVVAIPTRRGWRSII